MRFAYHVFHSGAPHPLSSASPLGSGEITERAGTAAQSRHPHATTDPSAPLVLRCGVARSGVAEGAATVDCCSRLQSMPLEARGPGTLKTPSLRRASGGIALPDPFVVGQRGGEASVLLPAQSGS